MFLIKTREGYTRQILKAIRLILQDGGGQGMQKVEEMEGNVGRGKNQHHLSFSVRRVLYFSRATIHSYVCFQKYSRRLTVLSSILERLSERKGEIGRVHKR